MKCPYCQGKFKSGNPLAQHIVSKHLDMVENADVRDQEKLSVRQVEQIEEVWRKYDERAARISVQSQ